MQIEQRRWTEATGWVPDLPGTLRESAQLVLVFGAMPTLREQKHFQEIKKAYPGAHIFGCSTAGEICGTQVSDDSLVTTAVNFAYTQLKAAVATRDIPIIVLSIVDNKDLGYRLGAFDYLLKPFDREAILDTLAHIAPPHRGRLLVVDDDPQVVDLVRQLLEDGPYEVEAAANGQEALEAISRQRPNVILLDLLMPQMDGFAVIEHLQQDPRYCDIPVIVLTAKTLTGDEGTLLQQSVRKVIQKRGLERDALIQEVRSALQAYRSTVPQG